MKFKLSMINVRMSSKLKKKTKLSDIDTMKFQKLIDAIGQNTLKEIALAGPEAQVELLKALGLSGFVMTDGNTPVNLFGFANNLVKKD